MIRSNLDLIVEGKMWAYFFQVDFLNSPVLHSVRHQRPARERHKIRIASRETVDNQAPRNTNFTHSMLQFTFKCGYNDFISKDTDINSLHVTQIDLLHNDTFCST